MRFNPHVKIVYELDHDTDDTLTCPHCESEYLHQRVVTVYDRSEDENTVLETTVSKGRTTVARTSGVSNPSDRRQGLSIRFYCEGCGLPVELTLAQHKGVTRISWRD